MGKWGRIKNFIAGCIIVLSAIIMIASDDGYVIVLIILSLLMVLNGLKKLIFYFTMARHMVGGKHILYNSIILLDFGLFTLMQVDIPRVFVMLYLIFLYLVSGVIHLLRGREARRQGSTLWRRTMVHGAVNVVLAITCIILFRHTWILIDLLGVSLLSSGMIRIVNSFRKTAIPYIQ